MPFPRANHAGVKLGSSRDGLFQVDDALRRRFSDRAADVVLKGIDAQGRICGEKGLFRHRVGGVELTGHAPGEAVEDVEQVL